MQVPVIHPIQIYCLNFCNSNKSNKNIIKYRIVGHEYREVFQENKIIDIRYLQYISYMRFLLVVTSICIRISGVLLKIIEKENAIIKK